MVCYMPDNFVFYQILLYKYLYNRMNNLDNPDNNETKWKTKTFSKENNNIVENLKTISENQVNNHENKDENNETEIKNEAEKILKEQEDHEKKIEKEAEENKKIEENKNSEKFQELKRLVHTLYSRIDKAAKKDVFHLNKSARQKSRIVNNLKKLKIPSVFSK